MGVLTRSIFRAGFPAHPTRGIIYSLEIPNAPVNDLGALSYAITHPTDLEAWFSALEYTRSIIKTLQRLTATFP